MCEEECILSSATHRLMFLFLCLTIALLWGKEKWFFFIRSIVMIYTYVHYLVVLHMLLFCLITLLRCLVFSSISVSSYLPLRRYYLRMDELIVAFVLSSMPHMLPYSLLKAHLLKGKLDYVWKQPLLFWFKYDLAYLVAFWVTGGGFPLLRIFYSVILLCTSLRFLLRLFITHL